MRDAVATHVAPTKGQFVEVDSPSPAVPAPAVVDQTGAGDAFVGTLTARLVLGDDFPTAARFGAAASSLVVGGKGGTGCIPTFEQTRAHASGNFSEGAQPSNA